MGEDEGDGRQVYTRSLREDAGPVDLILDDLLKQLTTFFQILVYRVCDVVPLGSTGICLLALVASIFRRLASSGRSNSNSPSR